MNKIFVQILNLTILLSGIFFPILIHANEKEKYQVKVVTEYLEPYQIQNKDGSLGGFSTDVVNALFKQANSSANIHVMPWARSYEVSMTEKNVMIYSIAHTKKRDPLFQWVGKLKEERLFFWGLKTRFPLPINTLALLKGYKIAASRQSNVAEYLKENNFFNVYQLIKEDQNMLMLYKDRVDLIVATELTLRNRAEKLGLDFNQLIKIREVKELNNELSIAFNVNSDKAMVTHFQKAYIDIQKQGIIKDLKAKWGVN